MYPSDYGYATSGGNTYNRSACMSKEMYYWKTDAYQTDCAGGSYLWDSTATQWTASPRSDDSYSLFDVSIQGGCVLYSDARNPYAARPVVYLASDIAIKSGDGSESNPYNLE